MEERLNPALVNSLGSPFFSGELLADTMGSSTGALTGLDAGLADTSTGTDPDVQQSEDCLDKDTGSRALCL